jgi:hypothetical protein
MIIYELSSPKSQVRHKDQNCDNHGYHERILFEEILLTSIECRY